MIKKSVIGISIFNILSIFGLVYLWQISIQTKIGCVCNYWKCVNSDIMMMPMFLAVIGIVNLVFIIGYIVNEIL